MSQKIIGVVGGGSLRAIDIMKNTPDIPTEKRVELTKEQTDKLADYLNASPDTIRYYYQNSQLLRGFYLHVLKERIREKE